MTEADEVRQTVSVGTFIGYAILGVATGLAYGVML